MGGAVASEFGGLERFARLAEKPVRTLDAMIAGGVNSPLSSSCGRLFDAAAALAGLAWEAQDHEGQAAMALEAAIDPAALEAAGEALRLRGRADEGTGLPYLDPRPAWRALLGDLRGRDRPRDIAARFHLRAGRRRCPPCRRRSAVREGIATAALSGGCFQNATLFALVHRGLRGPGLHGPEPLGFPANDGGLSLGQAVVALARIR